MLNWQWNPISCNIAWWISYHLQESKSLNEPLTPERHRGPGGSLPVTGRLFPPRGQTAARTYSSASQNKGTMIANVPPFCGDNGSELESTSPLFKAFILSLSRRDSPRLRCALTWVRPRSMWRAHVVSGDGAHMCCTVSVHMLHSGDARRHQRRDEPMRVDGWTDKHVLATAE